MHTFCWRRSTHFDTLCHFALMSHFATLSDDGNFIQMLYMVETRLHSNNLELHQAGSACWVLHSNHLTDNNDSRIFLWKTRESKMESDVYDSKCNCAFYSHHKDLEKALLYISTVIVIATFVILIDNTNFWLSTKTVITSDVSGVPYATAVLQPNLFLFGSARQQHDLWIGSKCLDIRLGPYTLNPRLSFSKY